MVSAVRNEVPTRRSKERAVMPARHHARKVAIDRFIGVGLLVISVPILVALVVLVRMTSRGGAIYKQLRVGKDGREFWLYKIRTMYSDAEALGGPQWAKPGDSRITPVGRALRFLHLDELPQLINVVRGEMSLIGPRPERPEFVEQLVQVIPNYRKRLMVLPGITGLAQINLPPDETLECVEKKVTVDCEYIENASPYLDVRILICTALRMLGVRHGRAPRWLGIEYRLPESLPNLEDIAELSLDGAMIDIPETVNIWDGNGDGFDINATREYVYAPTAAAKSADRLFKKNATSLRPR